ncbi:SIMPL domain-containing protein [Deinococcus ficus]|uniref:SIMPL domain-containing protein n=1 Tax=Deinococcus ficus TaxID=317577 RepID=UPI0003B3372E|nr:SIMPL domain-containing protein [Deinococcus ficus]
MGLLRVTVEDQAEVTAHAATLFVTVEGETFVMGNAALERAREVREFAQALQAAGVPAGRLHVQGVRIASSSGLLTKNQKAEFQLSAEATPEQLPAVLGVVAAGRNARLTRLDWQFDEFEASLPLAAQAMRKARRKADVIAGAAGQRVQGVHRASDTWELPGATMEFQPEGRMYALRAAGGPPLDVGVEYSATRTLRVTLTVDFTLEDPAQEPGPA